MTRGVGLPGVNVLVEGSSNGTQANIDGRYTVEAPAGATLIFSCVGYASQEVIVGDRTTEDVALAPASKLLGHVVVVGCLAQDRQNVRSYLVRVRREGGIFTQKVPIF